jgi:hypothetical protein
VEYLAFPKECYTDNPIQLQFDARKSSDIAAKLAEKENLYKDTVNVKAYDLQRGIRH